MPNPLISDREVQFVLYELVGAERLTALPGFAEHGRDTFDLYLEGARRFARESLFPLYRPMDEAPPRIVDGRVRVHPKMGELWRGLVELGVLSAARPHEVGGAQLPLTVAALASLYLGAANLNVTGFAMLTTGAAHLLEAFGDEALRREWMQPMYEGRITGTMALTEPQAGSSLADVRTRATPVEGAEHYLLRGSKIFISGGDHDLAENIVHLTLARIDGAPAGTKGISLFAVPRLRREGARLVENDVTAAGLVHKIGWKGLPSLVLELGTAGDCHGWLVGAPGQGLAYMFQMMNEARLMVGAQAVATASVAYHEALGYARDRPQGRPVSVRDAAQPQVPIIEHADVRRMLLRMKAIVEGGLALVAVSTFWADQAGHANTPEERKRAKLLLDLLTPIAKSFPAERGFEANALAVQIHGGYGYSSEALPESWLRDQKLNSIHEGTTGIQSLDLLGRKVMADGGAPLKLLGAEVARTIERAVSAGVDAALVAAVESAVALLGQVTLELGARGARGDVDGMLLHSADYLEAFSSVVVAWLWLWQAAIATEALSRGALPEPEEGFYRGKLAAAQYWIATELPKARAILGVCQAGEDSYARVRPEWL